MNLNTRLRQHTGLTPTERCLRDYILHYPERFSRMNTKQLAEASFTSAATIIRFCHKFGYPGLQEFKNDFFSTVQDALTFDLPDGNYPFTKSSSTEDVVRNILMLEEGTLRQLGAMLDLEMLEKAVGLMLSAGTIDLCAAGTGQYLLAEFQFRLNKIGFRVNSAFDSVSMSYAANQMDSTHCLVLLSYFGMNERIGQAIHHAREHHVKILLITSRADGPAAQMSDCVLAIPPLETCDDKISTFSSAAAQKAVLDFLYAKLFQENYEKNCNFVHEDADRLKDRRAKSFQESLRHRSK